MPEEEFGAGVVFFVSEEGFEDVESVDFGFVGGFGGPVDVGGAGEGGEEVHGADEFVAGSCGGDFAWPADDEGDAGAAFEGAPFFAAEGFAVGGFAGLWAVVGGEDDDGVFFEVEFLEGGEELADTVVHFLDDVAVFSEGGVIFPFGVGFDGEMGGAVGEVEEEGFVFVFAEEADGFGGEFFGEEAVFEGFFDDFVVAPDFIGLVVAEGDEVVVLEAAAVREGFWLGADVPFSGDGGGVAIGLEDFGDGEGFGAEGVGHGHFVADDAFGPAEADGVCAGEECHA